MGRTPANTATGPGHAQTTGRPPGRAQAAAATTSTTEPGQHAPARIALTSGEPGGIGPELCLAVARSAICGELVCIADRELLAERAALLGWQITLRDYDPNTRQAHVPNTLTVLHQPLAVPSKPGQLDKRNARYVLG